MKKILSLLFVLFLGFTLVACKDTNQPTPPDNNGDNGDNGDREFDLGGIDFIIMVDNANTADPRQTAFERPFKNEKVQKILDAEKKYNINVVYQTYPSEASWGGARERWIIQQTSLGNSPAHVYELSSYQIANLATQNAILPLNDLIEVYGNPGYWDEAKKYGEVNGKYYSYNDQYPFADDGLYYNVDLLAQHLGEDRKTEPTELWLEGKWDWAAFKALADELNSHLDENNPDGAQYV